MFLKEKKIAIIPSLGESLIISKLKKTTFGETLAVGYCKKDVEEDFHC